MRISHLLSAATLALLTATASAIDLASIGEGSYQNPFGFSHETNIGIGVHDTSYAGNGFGGIEFRTRGYVAFDLSSLTGPVGSAALVLKLTEYVSTGSTATSIFPVPPPMSNVTERFAIFDVSAPTASLTAPHGNASGNPFNIVVNTEGLAFFADLGEGTQLGEFDVSASSLGTPVTIQLNTAAIELIISHLGTTFALGIRHIGPEFAMAHGLIGFPLADQHITIDSTDGSQLLTVTSVPEPASSALLVTGLALLGVRRRGQTSAVKA